MKDLGVMPYGLGHFSRYRDTSDFIYLEEDDGQVQLFVNNFMKYISIEKLAMNSKLTESFGWK